jgi:hypothetical protein
MSMKDTYAGPPQVVEETHDYRILGWSTGERGIYCLNCAWISFSQAT